MAQRLLPSQLLHYVGLIVQQHALTACWTFDSLNKGKMDVMELAVICFSVGSNSPAVWVQLVQLRAQHFRLKLRDSTVHSWQQVSEGKGQQQRPQHLPASVMLGLRSCIQKPGGT